MIMINKKDKENGLWSELNLNYKNSLNLLAGGFEESFVLKSLTQFPHL
jgi:hypothetical protein